jgi:hypothetical protein
MPCHWATLVLVVLIVSSVGVFHVFRRRLLILFRVVRAPHRANVNPHVCSMLGFWNHAATYGAVAGCHARDCQPECGGGREAASRDCIAAQAVEVLYRFRGMLRYLHAHGQPTLWTSEVLTAVDQCHRIEFTYLR